MAKLDIYRRLIGYLRPYWPQATLAYTAMLFATLLNLFVPLIIKGAIDQGLDNDRPWALFIAAGLILAIAVVRGIAGFVQRYFGEWLSFRVAYDLRNNLYHSLQHLPFAFHDQAHTGDLMSRATGDITETERFVGIGLMELVATVLLLVGVVVAMLFEDVPLALLALIPFPILIVSTIRFGATVRPLSRNVQDQLGVLSTTMQESLTGIRVVKAFAREALRVREIRSGQHRLVPDARATDPCLGQQLAIFYFFDRTEQLPAALVWRADGVGRNDHHRHAFRYDLLRADAQRTGAAAGIPGQHGRHGRRQRQPRLRDHRYA